MIRNTQHRVANTWLVVAFLGVVMVVSVPFFDVDIFKGGGAMMVFGVLIAFTGLITGIIYRKRAQLLDTIAGGHEVIAEWTYDQELWRRYTQAEHSTRSAEVRGMYKLVFVIAFAVCAVLFLVADHDRWLFPVIFVCLMTIIGIVALLANWLPYRRNLRGPGTATISMDGIFFAGEFHSWGGPLLRFEGAEVTEEAVAGFEPVIVLAVTYAAMTRQGWQSQIVRIPVPAGREEEANRVAQRLQALVGNTD